MIYCDIRCQGHTECKNQREQKAYEDNPLSSVSQKVQNYQCSEKEDSAHLEQVPQYPRQRLILCQKSPVKGGLHDISPDKQSRLKFCKYDCCRRCYQIIEFSIRKCGESKQDQKTSDNCCPIPERGHSQQHSGK